MSKSLFLSGSLATYFGFASEYYDLKNKNPNLDFDVAPLPQAKGERRAATYGKMYGFSIVHTTPNPAVTYNVSLRFQILRQFQL
jgi:ABC-type glycerol-3-phosphate transport system substrate-binding protein